MPAFLPLDQNPRGEGIGMRRKVKLGGLVFQFHFGNQRSLNRGGPVPIWSNVVKLKCRLDVVRWREA